MKLFTRYITRIILPLTMVFCLYTTAYALGDYVTLAPLPQTTNCGTNVGTDCATNIQTYVPGLFNFAVGLAAVMAFAMISWGGFQYMTTDSVFGKKDGKDHIWNAVQGLLLVIGAYAILYTINPQILNFNLSIQKPEVQSNDGHSAFAIIPLTQTDLVSDNAIRTSLQTEGINVNHPACEGTQTQGCTNVVGLPEGAKDSLVVLKGNCKCDITITGGTEPGHQTHGVGQPIVDLSPSQSLDNWLGAPTPTEGQQVQKVINGQTAVFTYETIGGNAAGTSSGNHWHVKLY